MKRFVLALVIGLTACAQAQETLVKEVNFDKWEWLPIDKHMATMIKRFKENDDPVPVKINGPAYQAAVPCFAITGAMVPEAESVKGNAAYFESGKTPYTVGEHKPFGAFVKPDKEYRYEVYLKGQGIFDFKIWLSGVNKEGKNKFITVWSAANIKVDSNEWKKYEGTFKVPDNPDQEYNKYIERMLGGLMIGPNTKLYVDELKIYEK